MFDLCWLQTIKHLSHFTFRFFASWCVLLSISVAWTASLGGLVVTAVVHVVPEQLLACAWAQLLDLFWENYVRSGLLMHYTCFEINSLRGKKVWRYPLLSVTVGKTVVLMHYWGWASLKRSTTLCRWRPYIDQVDCILVWTTQASMILESPRPKSFRELWF